jgi:hypothetical protein
MFSSVISIQIFSVKNANPSFYEIHVENNYFPLPSKFEMEGASKPSLKNIINTLKYTINILQVHLKSIEIYYKYFQILSNTFKHIEKNYKYNEVHYKYIHASRT